MSDDGRASRRGGRAGVITSSALAAQLPGKSSALGNQPCLAFGDVSGSMADSR